MFANEILDHSIKSVHTSFVYSFFFGVLKKALCSFGEEIQTQIFYIHNINEVQIPS